MSIPLAATDAPRAGQKKRRETWRLPSHDSQPGWAASQVTYFLALRLALRLALPLALPLAFAFLLAAITVSFLFDEGSFLPSPPSGLTNQRSTSVAARSPLHRCGDFCISNRGVNKKFPFVAEFFPFRTCGSPDRSDSRPCRASRERWSRDIVTTTTPRRARAVKRTHLSTIERTSIAVARVAHVARRSRSRHECNARAT